MGKICFKYSSDIVYGLTFIAIIKRVHGKSANALIDFCGNITEKE